MAITPSFTFAPTSAPQNILLQDTSSGTDGNIASRTIFLYNADGTLLGSYPWPTAQSSITISPLTKDIALNIQIQWLDASGNSLYTSSQIAAFVGYGNLFLYGLTQKQAGTPNIIRDKNYYNSKMRILVELSSATNAITTGQDLYGAAQCLVRSNQYISQSSFYF